MNTEAIFSVKNLSCIRNERALFTHLSFKINASEALLIEGPNGSGKSSLLKILSGLATPLSGEIFWQGQNIRDILPIFRENFHYIGHTNGIKLGLTINENLMLAAHFSEQNLPKNTAEILDILQLTQHKNSLARQLSAGQKRRIALAKLLLFPKKLWLLDEPFTALDRQTQTYFEAHMHHHLQKSGMIIASSHHPMTISATSQIVRLTSC